jgi:hypothetical protein
VSHYRAECKHGVFMGQCRCPGPKVTRIVACPTTHADWDDDVRGSQPTLADYGAGGERRRIIAFLRAKAEELGPWRPTSNLALVQATLLDAAKWIENGDHL